MMSLEMATESNPLNGRRGAPADFFHGGVETLRRHATERGLAAYYLRRQKSECCR
jgi:hypothetical protein